MRVPVTVDSHLKIDGNLLGHDLTNDIFDALIVLNQARVEAERTKRWGWDKLPEDFQLGELDGDTLVLPRGFALELKRMLREQGHTVKWIDKRRWRKARKPYGRDSFKFRFGQWDAVKSVAKHQQGILKAPTGSGKTGSVIGAIWYMQPDHALIYVDKINLVDQWRKEFAKFLGVKLSSIGRIGEGKWIEGKHITVATIQTIHRKWDSPRTQRLVRRSDFVCLDECHHATAAMYNDVLDHHPARVRIGASATPGKTGEFALAVAVLGEVFYDLGHEELREQGILVHPHVEVIHTDFDFPYWRDHLSDEFGECEVPGCTKEYKHGHRNNYQKLKRAVIEDEQRNRIIVEQLQRWSRSPHHQLVASDQTEHIKFMAEIAEAQGLSVNILTGKQSSKKREEIQAKIENGEQSITFSTIANEALNIPVIDVIHLSYPGRNPGKVEQIIGRGTRAIKGKVDAVVIDYVDSSVHVLGEQYRSRLRKVYQPLELPVEIKRKGKHANERSASNGGLSSRL